MNAPAPIFRFRSAEFPGNGRPAADARRLAVTIALVALGLVAGYLLGRQDGLNQVPESQSVPARPRQIFR